MRMRGVTRARAGHAAAAPADAAHRPAALPRRPERDAVRRRGRPATRRAPTRSRAVPATSATCTSTSAATTATRSRRCCSTARLKAGDPLTVWGPAGEFVLADSGRPLAFVACDTGFAPIKSLIEHAMAVDAVESLSLDWLATRPDGHYLANQCRAWAAAFDHFRYAAHADPDPAAGARRAGRRDGRGVAARRIRRLCRGTRCRSSARSRPALQAAGVPARADLSRSSSDARRRCASARRFPSLPAAAAATAPAPSRSR